MEQENSRNKTTIMGAAKSGDADAQHAVGLLYLTSWKNDENSLGLAQEWLSSAAGQGHEEATNALEEVSDNNQPVLVSGM